MDQVGSLLAVAKNYRNSMRSQRAYDILEAAARVKESILDVGGGIAPFRGASHIVDILPYDEARLTKNTWGGKRAAPWNATEYTQFDCCQGRWPFEDQSFDIGCNLGMIEDVRDPIHVAQEMQRVCRKVLIETPSRLFEQTMGADHQQYAGFWHHRWMLFEKDGTFVCRVKTPIVNLPRCHFKIRPWQQFDASTAIFTFFARSPFPVEEQAYWSDAAEFQDLAEFVRRTAAPTTITIKKWRAIIYHLRQKILGVM